MFLPLEFNSHNSHIYAQFVDNWAVMSTAPLVSALLLSRLDYCNAVFAGLPAETLSPLLRVLNAAEVRPIDNYNPLLLCCQLPT